MTHKIAHKTTQERTREQIKRWQDTADQRAANNIVTQCLPMVKRYARAYTAHATQHYADAVSAGLEGLVEALNKFDPTIEVDFVYFARMQVAYKIRQFIKEHNKEFAFLAPTVDIEEYGADLVDLDTYYAVKTVVQREVNRLARKIPHQTGAALARTKRNIGIIGLRFEKMLTYGEISEIVGVSSERVAQVCRKLEGKLNG